MLFPLFVAFLLSETRAVPFPPPTGPYRVGITQHVLNHTTPNDPFNATSLLATIYYPTKSLPDPGSTATYLDSVTANLWGTYWGFPRSYNAISNATSLFDLTTWNTWQAPTLDSSTGKPTVILSPGGGGPNAIMYNQISSELASQGYPVLALDHPGEAPYVHLPDEEGVKGLEIDFAWDEKLFTEVYEMRVSDTLAVVRDLYPTLVRSHDMPFNTTHYFMLGHSLGGSAASGAMALETSIIGGINFDGAFFDTLDIKKPFLLITNPEHNSTTSPSLPQFLNNQTGWWEWISVQGSGHLSFSDVGNWVDLQGLRNRTKTRDTGTIWAPRMDVTLKRFTLEFFESVLMGKPGLQVPNALFPEVLRIDESEHKDPEVRVRDEVSESVDVDASENANVEPDWVGADGPYGNRNRNRLNSRSEDTGDIGISSKEEPSFSGEVVYRRRQDDDNAPKKSLERMRRNDKGDLGLQARNVVSAQSEKWGGGYTDFDSEVQPRDALASTLLGVKDGERPSAHPAWAGGDPKL